MQQYESFSPGDLVIKFKISKDGKKNIFEDWAFIVSVLREPNNQGNDPGEYGVKTISYFGTQHIGGDKMKKYAHDATKLEWTIQTRGKWGCGMKIPKQKLTFLENHQADFAKNMLSLSFKIEDRVYSLWKGGEAEVPLGTPGRVKGLTSNVQVQVVFDGIARVWEMNPEHLRKKTGHERENANEKLGGSSFLFLERLKNFTPLLLPFLEDWKGDMYNDRPRLPQPLLLQNYGDLLNKMIEDSKKMNSAMNEVNRFGDADGEVRWRIQELKQAFEAVGFNLERRLKPRKWIFTPHGRSTET